MAGLCLIFHRDGRPVPPRALSSMAACLAHRGPDGASRHLEGPMALAGQWFWTTPEDRGGRLPLRHRDGRTLLWDGRLDNRDELIDALGVDRQRAAGLPDAALVLEAHARWDDDAWARLLGPFAAAVCDPARRTVTLARDPLGDRTLFFHLGPDRLVVASEEQALLAHPELPRRADRGHVARFLAVAEPSDGSTFFAGVTELLPGHRLAVGERTVRRDRFWRPEATPRLRYRHRRDYEEHFLELLTRAVTARLRSTTPPVLQLSGGLDSTSIAVVAAGAGGAPLKALSWVFTELDCCDERRYMEELYRRFPIEPVHLPADGQPAFFELDRWPNNPNAPEETPFRPLVETMYRTAGDLGSRVMLTGLWGDNLFLGGERWWLDALRHGSLPEALAAGWRQARRLGAGRFLWRHAVRPLLPGRAGRAAPPPAGRGWLTAEARRLLAGPEAPWPPWLTTAQRPQQHLRVLSLMNARATVTELFHLRSSGLDLRNPYRDRRLVEFMLAVPAFALESDGVSKSVLRGAMRGLLPQRILARRDKTSFAELYRRGTEGESRQRLWRTLSRSGGPWRELVDPSWLKRALGGPVEPLPALVFSRCLFLGRWMASVGVAEAEAR
jgi:asparagine synthase (glutamine-hydrolysing)